MSAARPSLASISRGGGGRATSAIAPTCYVRVVGCLEENTLFELVRGELGEARRRAAIHHADGCDACRRLLAAVADELVPSQGHDVGGSVPRHELLGGKYRLERRLGSGGMGTVYEAVNTWTRGRVAVKVMHASFASDSLAVRRFVQEAQSATRITHPNVVEVLDVGEDGEHGTLYIVQEFLRGVTMRQRLNERGRLAVDEALALAIPVLSALVAAHESGVLHRDVKPENIILARDRDGRETPKLIDFGLSKQTQSGEGLLVSDLGRPLGTPFYMSPEQLLVDPSIDERTDVWSLGVVLFEAVAGERPFRGPAYRDLVMQLLHEPVPQLLAPGVPAALTALVGRALDRDRERRLRARELRDALLRLTGRASALQLPEGNPYRGIAPFEAEHRGLLFGRQGS